MDISFENISLWNFTLSDSVVAEAIVLPYYGHVLDEFRIAYASVHGYLSLACCIFGITSNILIIIVLTRKNMISPTNTILIGLAVSDVLVMFSYIPFAYHNYIRKGLEDKHKFAYSWAVFTLLHQHFTIVCHNISTWLTVTLAIWRFLAITLPNHAVVWCSMSRAILAIAITYVMCSLFAIPAYFNFEIYQYRDEGNDFIYQVDFSKISHEHNKLLQKVTFWTYSVLMKLVPCVLLTGISFGLIKVLYERNQRRHRLMRRPDSESNHDNTTRMLLVVLLLFLITEFPSGLLALLTGILGSDFYENVYFNFGEVMDSLALVNNAINFIIYCVMSRDFRSAFASLFLSRMLTVTPNVSSAQTV